MRFTLTMQVTALLTMLYNFVFLALLSGFFLSDTVTGYWRMSCMGVVGRGLIDPIVAPDKVSEHLHTLKGASGISSTSTVDELLASNCTSCEISQDHSAYWSPNLMFFDQDTNSYELVHEVAGHITYYKYVPAFISNGSFVNPVAIPNGMKMISGSNYRRNFTLPVPDPPLPWSGSDATQDALMQKAVGFNCLDYSKAPEGTLQRHFLPDKTFLEQSCPDGIRMEVLFPMCWNGKDLSSPDFHSHVAYSDAGANGGNCPKGYDVPILQLLFETIYPTQNFVGKNGYYLFANGDPTGHGYHGDAYIAWEGTVQEDATAECGSPVSGFGTTGVPDACPVFDIQSPTSQTACSIQSAPAGVAGAKMNLAAPMNILPGGVIPQSGPAQATPPAQEAEALPTQAAVPSKAAPSPAAPIVPSPAPPVVPSPPSTTKGIGAPLPKPAPSTPAAVPTLSSSSLVPAPTPTSAPEPGSSTVFTVYSTKSQVVYEIVNIVEYMTKTMDEAVASPAAAQTPAVKKRGMGHAKAHVRRSHGHHHGHA